MSLLPLKIWHCRYCRFSISSVTPRFWIWMNCEICLENGNCRIAQFYRGRKEFSIIKEKENKECIICEQWAVIHTHQVLKLVTAWRDHPSFIHIWTWTFALSSENHQWENRAYHQCGNHVKYENLIVGTSNYFHYQRVNSYIKPFAQNSPFGNTYLS